VTTSVVVGPTVRFEAIEAVLHTLGFHRADVARSLPKDATPGEPEAAEWSRGAPAERITYTFNPVVSLRVLTCGAETAAQLGAHLPLLTNADLVRLLSDSEPRRVLLGLLAALAVGADEWSDVIAPLRAHPDPRVRRAAESVLPRSESGVKVQALASSKLLSEQAVPVVAALVGPDGPARVEALRPRDGDYASVFDSAIVTRVRAAYEPLWRTTPKLERPVPGALTVRVDAAPAGMLREDNELSRRFPGGYRALAPHLRPERIWFVWQYLRSGESAGMRYDGLVRLPDRWVWFPKPYRIVGEILRPKRSEGEPERR